MYCRIMCICISNLKRECTGRDGNVLSIRVKNTCCLRNRIQYATNCISPRVTSLLRSFRAANRYEHSRVASHRSMLIPVVVANVLAHW